MSRERNADEDAELQASLKAELRNTTAQRVLAILAEAMSDLVVEDPDIRHYWADGYKQTRLLSKESKNWG
jgi:hypothetical protein